jgi:hypothetical protein
MGCTGGASFHLIDDQVYEEFAYHQFLLCVYLDPFITMYSSTPTVAV